ncbi:hypothetical protein HHK36_002168 [Tetracentron sinense]|uniref:Ubiquitin-specific protease family C19-related protein n=1 Tax=Tetracentron sinense TaxID=13715 RepID=A0A835DVF5_TETSI|nr:hypothetical protein HHK36_002168 [Tetracentron sinense]
MATRIPSHQLSSGLYVSGRPEQHKERQPTMGARAVPYTGGDVKKSGELGKMFDIAVVDPSSNAPPPSKPSRPSSSSQHNSGSLRSGSSSGPLPKSSNSGPLQKKSSGPMPLQPTGLITSGPITSSGSGSGGGGPRRSGQLEPSGSMGKAVYGAAVTSLSEEVKFGFKVSKAIMWVFLVVLVMGLLVGTFMMVTVKKAVILVVVGAILVPVIVFIGWNYAWGKKGLLGFLRRYPDAELRAATNGQYVKVTGDFGRHLPHKHGCAFALQAAKAFYRVHGSLDMSSGIDLFPYPCHNPELEKRSLRWSGSVPLRQCGSGDPLSMANIHKPTSVHWLSPVAVFLWNHLTRRYLGVYTYPRNYMNIEDGVESLQILSIVHSRGDQDIPRSVCQTTYIEPLKHVADFYISDFQSGLRALVKAGYGAKVAPFVKPATVVDITKENRELSPTFLRWLADHNLSSDDRVMRLKEGYIKEGSTVSVMGVVQRHDNVLMIIPSAEPVSTGCQWIHCLLPTHIEGLILTCDESQNSDVIAV